MFIFCFSASFPNDVGVESFLIHTRSYYKSLFKTMQISIGAISCVDGYGIDKFLNRLEKVLFFFICNLQCNFLSSCKLLS
jgi:hypothetical protein